MTKERDVDGMRLPPSWVEVSLEQVAEVRLGRQRSPSRAVGPNMVSYLRAANVTWKGIDLEDVKEMDFTPEEQETYRLEPGDILLSEASGSAHEVGKPALWQGQIERCCFQNTLIRVRTADQGLARYLHRHFLADAMTGRFGAASRGVGIHHLGAKAMSEWKVRLAPARTRERIVEAIDAHMTRLDEANTILERVQRNLKRYRASVLKAAVEGRLVPTEAELARAEKRDYEPASVLLQRILTERRQRWALEGRRGKYVEPEAPDTKNLPELPEGWCWATVDQLLEKPLCHGRSVPTSESGFPVLRLTAVKGEQVDLAERKGGLWTEEDARPFLVSEGDFLVSRGNGSLRLVGRGALVSVTPDPVAFPDTLIRVRCSSFISRLYLSRVWNSHPVRSHIERRAKTTAGIYKINQDDLRATPIPLAPGPEQQRIVLKLDELLSAAENTSLLAEVQARRISRLRQSILKWAFEGKLIDQDPADESASALLARIKGTAQQS